MSLVRRSADPGLFWVVWLAVPVFVSMLAIGFFLGRHEVEAQAVGWLADKLLVGAHILALSRPVAAVPSVIPGALGLAWLWRRPVRPWRRAALLAPVVFTAVLCAVMSVLQGLSASLVDRMALLRICSALRLGAEYFCVLPGLAIERFLMWAGVLARAASSEPAPASRHAGSAP